MSLGELMRDYDKPSPGQRRVFRERHAIVRKDDVENFWYVVYYRAGHRLFVIDWDSWSDAHRQALIWVGLAR